MGLTRKEIHRKMFHFPWVFVIPLHMLFPDATFYVVAGITAAYAPIFYLRKAGIWTPLNRAIETYSRKYEKGLLSPPFFFLISITMLLFLVPGTLAYVGIIAMTVGDTFALILGNLIVSRKIIHDKTLPGLIGFFMATFPALAIILQWELAVIVAATGAVVEIISSKYDNLTVPLATAAVTIALI